MVRRICVIASFLYLQTQTEPQPEQDLLPDMRLHHQFIDWHNISPHGYLDDEKTLSSQITDEFEQEANYLGASLIYQGTEFITKTRSVKPTISAILNFAQMHDASFMATAWQFINASDESVAVGFLLPA